MDTERVDPVDPLHRYSRQILVDGTDNFPTRFLVNDYAVRRGCLGCPGASSGRAA